MKNSLSFPQPLATPPTLGPLSKAASLLAGGDRGLVDEMPAPRMQGFLTAWGQGRRAWPRVVALLLALAGCSGPTHPTAYPVEGTVLFQGKPVAGALVIFHPLDSQLAEIRPRAYADSEGHFQLTTFATADGAPPGRYAITVEWLERPVSPNGEEVGVVPNKLPARYSNPTSSRLVAEVTASHNELPPLQLVR